MGFSLDQYYNTQLWTVPLDILTRAILILLPGFVAGLLASNRGVVAGLVAGTLEPYLPRSFWVRRLDNRRLYFPISGTSHFRWHWGRVFSPPLPEQPDNLCALTNRWSSMHGR